MGEVVGREVKGGWFPVVVVVLAMVLSGCGWFSGQKRDPLVGISPYRVLEMQVDKIARRYQGYGYEAGADPDREKRSDSVRLVVAMAKGSLEGSSYRFAVDEMAIDLLRERSDPLSRSEVRPGDLIYFRPQRWTRDLAHVAMVSRVDPDGTLHFYHATPILGVNETTTEAKAWKFYWTKHFDSFRRFRPDLFTGTPAPKKCRWTWFCL